MHVVKYKVSSFIRTFYFVWFFHPKRHILTLQRSRRSGFSRASGVAYRGIRFYTSLSLELCSHGMSTVSASKEPVVRDTAEFLPLKHFYDLRFKNVRPYLFHHHHHHVHEGLGVFPVPWSLTLNLPTTTIVAQPLNVIKWQLKFNLVA